MIAFLSGLLAGSLHVVSGPDHVAAVAPLTLRTPRSGSVLGALWGVGHGGGVLLWVVVAAAFQRVFGRELPSAPLEALVGVALIGLGLISFRRARPGQPHVHVHAHGHVADHVPVPDGRAHVHFHVHADGRGHVPHVDWKHAHRHREPQAGWRGPGTALAMGALHGSAGASHLLAMLPTLGLREAAALSYGGGYLLAGVLAMMGVSTFLAQLGMRLGDPVRWQRLCALSVLAIGVFWLVRAAWDLV